MSSQKLLDKISNLIGASPPFAGDSVALPENELEIVLIQLQNYKRPNNFEIMGERPLKVTHSPEHEKWYREKSSDYIYTNTGIRVPASSSVLPEFYCLMMDYLKL